MEKMYLVECWHIKEGSDISVFYDSNIVATAREAIIQRELYEAQKLLSFKTVVDTSILKPDGLYNVSINFGDGLKSEKRRFMGLKNMLAGVKEAFREKNLDEDYGYSVIAKTYFRYAENYAEYEMEVYSL